MKGVPANLQASVSEAATEFDTLGLAQRRVVLEELLVEIQEKVVRAIAADLAFDTDGNKTSQLATAHSYLTSVLEDVQALAGREGGAAASLMAMELDMPEILD